MQDVGIDEHGIGNIKVQLMDATGTNVLKTTYTNSSGNYKFSNLEPWRLCVAVRQDQRLVLEQSLGRHLQHE